MRKKGTTPDGDSVAAAAAGKSQRGVGLPPLAAGGAVRYEQLTLVAEGPALMLGKIHEACGEARDMFPLVAARALAGPVFWLGLRRTLASLSPTGLGHYIDPSRLLTVVGDDRRQLLWAAEQSLAMKGAALVVLELRDGPNLRESRRLQVAAEARGGLGIVLIERWAQSSAAQTRWLCEPLPATESAEGAEEWIWRNTKNRAGSPGTWRLRWSGGEDAPNIVDLAAAAPA